MSSLDSFGRKYRCGCLRCLEVDLDLLEARYTQECFCGLCAMCIARTKPLYPVLDALSFSEECRLMDLRLLNLNPSFVSSPFDDSQNFMVSKKGGDLNV